MINDESRRKLREMNLGEIISGLEAQQAEPATLGLPFDDRMQRLVDYVYQEKYNAKIQRLIRSAKLRFPQADLQGHSGPLCTYYLLDRNRQHEHERVFRKTQEITLRDGSQRRTGGSLRKISGTERSSAPDPLARNNHVKLKDIKELTIVLKP